MRAFDTFDTFDTFVRFVIFLESRFDDFVSLESWDKDVEQPEEDKDSRSNALHTLGATKFTTDWRIATDHQNDDSQQSLNAENGHREA